MHRIIFFVQSFLSLSKIVCIAEGFERDPRFMLTSGGSIIPLMSARIGTVRLYLLHREKKDKERVQRRGTSAVETGDWTN